MQLVGLQRNSSSKMPQHKAGWQLLHKMWWIQRDPSAHWPAAGPLPFISARGKEWAEHFAFHHNDTGLDGERLQTLAHTGTVSTGGKREDQYRGWRKVPAPADPLANGLLLAPGIREETRMQIRNLLRRTAHSQACTVTRACDDDSEDNELPPQTGPAVPLHGTQPTAFAFTHACQGDCNDLVCHTKIMPSATPEPRPNTVYSFVDSVPQRLVTDPLGRDGLIHGSFRVGVLASADPVTTASAALAQAVGTTADPTSTAPPPTSASCLCQPFCRAPVQRPWSDMHHWRERDPTAATWQHKRAMRCRDATMRWMLGEAPEGCCEMCIQLPTCVVELACGHWLCDSCMRKHAANRSTGRACMACRARTIRPEVSWIRWEAPPTEEQRNARREEWKRTNHNPITIIYDYQPPPQHSLPWHPPPPPPVQLSRGPPLQPQLQPPGALRCVVILLHNGMIS